MQHLIPSILRIFLPAEFHSTTIFILIFLALWSLNIVRSLCAWNISENNTVMILQTYATKYTGYILISMNGTISSMIGLV